MSLTERLRELADILTVLYGANPAESNVALRDSAWVMREAAAVIEADR